MPAHQRLKRESRMRASPSPSSTPPTIDAGRDLDGEQRAGEQEWVDRIAQHVPDRVQRDARAGTGGRGNRRWRCAAVAGAPQLTMQPSTVARRALGAPRGRQASETAPENDCDEEASGTR